MAIQQVSGSNNVQLNGLLKYSGQSDDTASQEYTVRVMYNANNAPRYMQTACNHMQVGAKCDRSPPALVPTASIPHRAALMADLMSLPSGSYRRVMVLITICNGRPTELLVYAFL